MQILYLYDVKAKNKTQFNRTKRIFYYHLAKLALKKDAWRTKSALLVSKKHENALDAFFKRFGDDVEAYKAQINNLQEIK